MKWKISMIYEFCRLGFLCIEFPQTGELTFQIQVKKEPHSPTPSFGDSRQTCWHFDEAGTGKDTESLTLITVLIFHRAGFELGVYPLCTQQTCAIWWPLPVVFSLACRKETGKELCNVNFRPLEVLSQELTHGSPCFRGLGHYGRKDTSEKKKSPKVDVVELINNPSSVCQGTWGWFF